MALTKRLIAVFVVCFIVGVGLVRLDTQGLSGGFVTIIQGGRQASVTAGNALKVDGSAAGSGSVTQGTSPWIVAGGGTAGAAGSAVLTVQGIASGTAVPVSGTVTVGTFPDNEPFNIAQINGVTPLMGNGGTGTGSPRVTIANDNTAFSVNIGTFPDNEPFNVAQIGGTAVVADPCQAIAKTYTPVDIVTATTVRIIAPTSAKRSYICAISLFAGGTDNVGIVEGTGGTCGSSTAGIFGGTTAAEGLNLIAQTGIAWGNGAATVMASAGTNVDVCLITSAAVQLSGHVAWVQQ